MDEPKKTIIPVIAAIDGVVLEAECEITPGLTTVAQVLDKTALLSQLNIDKRHDIGFGSYGEVKLAEDVLDEYDRLEILQKLKLDPTESRRLKGVEEKNARQKKKQEKTR
ncbi:MAG: RnfH family protein [Gammaproteobacteria bacterium]|nr:RnfH family protein [Pseudomonadota bacterium]MCH9662238.1 RnfH family protein [Gammaproteobacteria bacterium]